jgi:exopolysaccharide biosynthesis polyprenyl glycosylphosphotransferase
MIFLKKDTIVTSLYKILILLVDIILLYSSIYISFMLKFDMHPPKFNYEPFITIFPFISVSYLIFMYVYGLGDIIKQTINDIGYSMFLVIIALTISTMAITFFVRAFSYPRSVMLIGALFQYGFLTLWRIAVWKVMRIVHGKKLTTVIGAENCEHIARKLLTKQSEIYNIRHICHYDCEKLWDYIKETEVVFLCEEVNSEIRNKIIDVCLDDRKSLYIIPRVYDIALQNSKLQRVDDIPVLKVKKIGLTIEQKISKRLLDVILASVGIVLSLPLMLVISVLIKLEDKGPVIYMQERITEGGRIFNVMKFRTMIINAEQYTGPVFSGNLDPRITKIGRVLRAARMDELPQLFNIISGDMSVVGPRPERPFFVEQFKKSIPDYKYRTLVKAGLTGLAQVLGRYNTTAEDKVRYDILYIKNYSIFYDIKLILQTIKIIFVKDSTEGIRDEISLDKIIDEMQVEVNIDKE